MIQLGIGRRSKLGAGLFGEEGVKAGAMGVSSHGGLDFEGEGEGFPALASGNSWLLAGADRVEEGLDLEAEGFAGGDLGLDEGEAWGGS